MTFLPDLSLVFDSLGWAVLHSIWQGAVAALMVWAFRIFTRHSAADLRYMFGFATLSALFAAFVATFLYYFSVGSVAGETTISLFGLTALELAAASNTATTSPLMLLFNSTNLIGSVWAVCFGILGARYMAAFRLTNNLRKTGLSALPGGWQTRFDVMAQKCQIGKKTRAYVSEHVSSPITFGFFKPIVLVPTWFFTGMDSEQCEAVLLHELAHIRRYDYVANILQIMIKTVFFYHPAVQYISKTVDSDREDACDDYAVDMTRDPESLARALGTIRLKAARSGGVFALSADGPDAPLMHRLKRLMGTPTRRGQTGAVRGFASTSMLVISCGLVLVLGATQSQAHPQSEADIEAEADQWTAESDEELAGAAFDKWENKNYNYGTFIKDGKTYKIKTSANGKSWIKIDGNWFDIKTRPDLNIIPPEAPRIPSHVMSPRTAPTPATMATPRVPNVAPVSPVSGSFAFRTEPDEEVMAELARELAEEQRELAEEFAQDQQELAEELAEAQHEVAQAMEDLQRAHAQELAEYERELAERPRDMKSWDQEDRDDWAEEHAEIQRELQELNRELIQEQANLQRELADNQSEVNREMADLQRELAEEQRELQIELAEEVAELEHEYNYNGEWRQAELERVKADRRTKDYEKMRERLIPVLMADGYMTDENSKVEMKLTETDIFINGKQVNSANEGKYCDIVSDYIDRKGDVKKIVFKPGYMHVEAKGKNGHSSYTHRDDD